MQPSIIDAIGWAGNACYFLRFFIQWWSSERAGCSVTPRSFWPLSLAGALLHLTYSAMLREPVLFFGYLVAAAIYVRNVGLMRTVRAATHRPPLRLRTMLPILGGALCALVVIALGRVETQLPLPVVLAGVVGQALFSSRLLVAWWYAERRQCPDLPAAFWWTSLAGNSLLLCYLFALGNPVWIVGLSLGPFVQARNLMLIARRAVARPTGQ